ncbi:MAG TPA: hypothetical protein VFK13_11015 [Gemmatimonadaceae bacterium]|nr:hypothetical protein [Gemmatimonadaceae bacterium]
MTAQHRLSGAVGARALRVPAPRTLTAIALGAAVLGAAALGAQPTRPARPRAAGARTQEQPPAWKGIWEPVSYGADVSFTDVYFVTPEEGWVSGGVGNGGGTLLHTSDGGTTWDVALGDPQGSQRAFYHLRFVDRSTGFVVQGTDRGDHTLLRTTDGSTWEATGTVPQHHTDYLFTSATTGVASDGHRILRTTDAGRRWEPAFECALTLHAGGLTKQVRCTVDAFAFPTPSRGYAIGGSYDVRGLYVFRTADGGATWTGALVLPGEETGKEGHIFFADDETGYICTARGSLFGTRDGGETWKGLPGSSCEEKAPIRFADPEVGWAVRYTTMTFTADGGRRWLSREIAFPAPVAAFSLPRRNRAYAVGDHGMIFRYRVVPAATTVANALTAPAMPRVSSALDTSVARMETQLAAFDSLVQAMPAAGASAGQSTADAGGFVQDTSLAFLQSAPGAFTAECCGKRLSAFDLALQAVRGFVPDFLARYRNLNLLVQGLRTATALPETAGQVRAAYRAFRTAGDRDSAASALADLKSALATLRAGVDTAMQAPSTPFSETSQYSPELDQ